MIRTLRKKFIIVAMSSTFVVLAAIMLVMNILSYQKIISRADELTEYLVENDGKFDEHFMEEPSGDAKKQPSGQGEKLDPKEPANQERFSMETPFETRFFVITFASDGSVDEIDTESVAAISDTQAEEYAKQVQDSGKKIGFQGIYRYYYTEDMAVFVDCGQELNSFCNQLMISVSVSVGGLFAVFVLVLIFSRIVFRPVEESLEKQKRFITDASHEIKTPLTIIDANTEVIEMMSGENQWTKSTHNQIQRLTQMTRHLVELSKLNEGQQNEGFVRFALSDAVADTVQPYESVMQTEGKKLNVSLEDDLYMKGDETSIRKLVGILMDNAVKYSLPESSVDVSLKKVGGKIRFTVSNQAEGFPQEDMNELFDRFYRMDASRNSETGGSGIGLSIAKAIMDACDGKITATSPDRKKLVITAEFHGCA